MDRDFKVGDRVRIRSWDDMVKEYGLDWEGDIPTPCYFFIDKMRILCGVEATITKIDDEKVTLDQFDKHKDEGGKWNYSIFMIEKI